MEKKIEIKGMMCIRCQARVEKALSAIPGVTAAKVDLAAGVATVTLSEDVADQVLCAAVAEKGFTPVRVF